MNTFIDWMFPKGELRRLLDETHLSPRSKAQREKWRKMKRNKRKGVFGKRQALIEKYLIQHFSPFEFKSVRPSWLKNPETKRNLELDFFCPELKLGIEIQGEQHYAKNVKFHGEGKQGDTKFEKQQQRDTMKRVMCRQVGVDLIEIPFWIPIDGLEEELKFRIGRWFRERISQQRVGEADPLHSIQ